jgi:hypothetical protein
MDAEDTWFKLCPNNLTFCPGATTLGLNPVIATGNGGLPAKTFEKLKRSKNETAM